MPALTRLTLTDFRSYAAASISPGPGFVLLSGDNGAGKTNILEAVSLLTPGRGLRGAALSEMARQGGSGAFSVAARLREADLGTGTLPGAPERRLVRVNGVQAAVNGLSEWLSVLWLTPAMDRLFSGSAGERRRFLDRLVLALEPNHAHHFARYEAAMRARNKLLAEPPWEEDWLAALEAQMGEHGAEVSAARLRTVADLADAIDSAPDSEFPRAGIALDGWKEAHLADRLLANRARDSAAARAIDGPHRQDLAVTFQAKSQPAARSSTGEQKALLLGIVLAHASLVAERRNQPPLLLLDEVAAHLDPHRRAGLFGRLEGHGQVWMTATESALFGGIAQASRFHVEPGVISPG